MRKVLFIVPSFYARKKQLYMLVHTITYKDRILRDDV